MVKYSQLQMPKTDNLYQKCKISFSYPKSSFSFQQIYEENGLFDKLTFFTLLYIFSIFMLVQGLFLLVY